MSLVGRNFDKVATVWPVERDQYSQLVPHTPFNIQCTWKDTGDTQKDESGEEFVPQQTFYCSAELKRDWFIVKGDFIGVENPSDAGASKILKITEYPTSRLRKVPCYEVFT